MKNKIVLFISILSISCISLIGYKIFEYKAYVWLPYYIQHKQLNNFASIKDGHVMLILVDHHEPGRGVKGIERSREWNAKYRKVVAGISDDYGNPIQYSWFYPYDHKNEGVLSELNKLVFDGLGEVEFHWHHGSDTNASFSLKLDEGMKWFNAYGMMLPIGEESKPAFGFIHGNWALDNSVPGHSDWCGVNRELDILKSAGCYADFTFATLGSLAQPTQVNSIYYGVDDDNPKSYDVGDRVKVSGQSSGLMIFQGPMGLDWRDFCFDCAAVEHEGEFKQHRAKLWLSHAPHVLGRKNWFFVKVNTHGRQSSDVILSENFRELYQGMKEVCRVNNLSLHFVTARQAYNIVKAAEASMVGDPEQYKDYIIKPPIDKFVLIQMPLKKIVVDENLIEVQPLLTHQVNSYNFKIGPVSSVSGLFSRYICRREDSDSWKLIIEPSGAVQIKSKNEFKIVEQIAHHEIDLDGSHLYFFDGATSVDVNLEIAATDMR